jgi:hypothetical protein
VIVYVLTRRWEARFRAAARAARAARAAVPAARPDEPADDLADDGPMLVDPAVLRGLIRDVVRQELVANRPTPPAGS